MSVTYGDRKQFLSQVLPVLLKDALVWKIVLVSNGAPWNVREFADHWGNDRIDVVTLKANEGSGAGFAEGIRRACDLGADFIWLLDDDNVPEQNALPALLNTYDGLRATFPANSLAVAALRPMGHPDVVGGFASGRLREQRVSSFWEFHIFDVPTKLWHRTPWGRPRPAASIPPVLEMAYAPYGGLLFHRSVVEKHGLPRSDFILYGDDREFTYRIERHGGAIRLVTSARMRDIEEHWSFAQPRFGNAFLPWLEGTSDMRAFYRARGKTYLDKYYLPNNRLMFWFNRKVYGFGLWLFALALRRTDRYRLLQDAIRDGLAGQLGMSPRFPL